MTAISNSIATFAEFKLIDPIQRALVTEGYTTPTPIQVAAIPPLLAGRDLLGCAQTGTGKTAAFALPILNHLTSLPRPDVRPGARVLVLTPTRELAIQIADNFNAYGRHLRHKTAVIFGGVGQGPQVQALRRGDEILVATPGRLLDLMQQGHARLNGIEILVLDEADRMLDMGFIQPIRRILGSLPRKRQNMLFSATMPNDIAALAAGILVDPVKVAVTPVSSTAEKVEQSVLFVEHANKPALLAEVLRDPAMTRVLVFTRTKHGANRVAERLDRSGVRAEAIHGNKSQGARQRALEGFKGGRVRVLVATDIASRGIDVDGVTHVINFELPNEPESYVHRIGRTARAGASGIALSFCAAEERGSLRDIERLTQVRLKPVENHLYASASAGPATPASASGPRGPGGPPPRHRPRGGGGGGGRSRSFGAARFGS